MEKDINIDKIEKEEKKSMKKYHIIFIYDGSAIPSLSSAWHSSADYKKEYAVDIHENLFT